MPNDQPDPIDTLLKRTPSWEPPDGFAMRVTLVVRASSEAEQASRSRLRDRFDPVTWLRGWASSLRMRADWLAWSLQQYRSLVGW